jgi:anaerobic magnesium-protoporphyrin IX monomethyl ester cyclase
MSVPLPDPVRWRPPPASGPEPRPPAADRESRSAGSVRYLLISPPLTDPTCPYHSIPYLVGAARAAGFTGGRCLDANIEALNYLARPEQVRQLLDRVTARRAEIERQATLTRSDEMAYQIALSASGLRSEAVGQAIAIFRDGELFHHYPTYRQAVMVIRRWLNLLSLDGVPAQFDGFELRLYGSVSLASYDDMADDETLRLMAGPFQPYLDGPYQETLREQPWDVIGFSVSYLSQLPLALQMARQARAACPGAVIVFGGTEVGDDVRYLRTTSDIWRLFRDADLIVPGEGETPFTQILARVRDGQPLTGIGGSMAREAADRTVRINYENIAALPPPAYDVWDWPAYWNPEPVVLYSPTRGCYWNKCTFCDYGLNTDRPTAPSRERSVETVMADLAEIARFSKVVYFAVDAMSPRFLRTLGGAMATAGLGLSWSAEIRLERTFPKRGVAALLAASGCVSASFGYESATQRILDLIDKGVRIEGVATLLAELAEQDIGAQLMGFTGFPSETADEANETFGYLARHGELWSLAGIGRFTLTPGSIVAKQPARFGIELLPAPPTDDVRRFLPWRHAATGTEHWPADTDERITPESRKAVLRGVNGRPFVGGIDAAHTLLYFRANGRGLVADRSGEPLVKLVTADVTGIPFANLADFTTAEDLAARHQELQQRGGATRARLAGWLGEPGAGRRGPAAALVLPFGAPIALAADADYSPDSPVGVAVRMLAHAARA